MLNHLTQIVNVTDNRENGHSMCSTIGLKYVLYAVFGNFGLICKLLNDFS